MFRIESLVVGPFQSNCHVVACTESKEAVIFDAGADAPGILGIVKMMGVGVKAIVNTHAHIDHVSGLADVVDALGVPVFMHREEMPVYQSIAEQAAMFGLPAPRTVPIHRWLEEGDVVNVGKLRGEVMWMPGHSPGHIVVVFKDGAPPRAIVGDVLFQGSIGRTDILGGDHSLMMKTLERFLPMPDETVVYCGHGMATTIGEEKKWNPFLAPLAARARRGAG